MRNQAKFKFSLAKRFAMIALISLMLAMGVPIALAHTPLKPGHENHTLETALEIPNPTKSWTLYRELHETNEPEYFKLQLKSGEHLRISLYVPTTEDPNFLPNLIVMGSDITSDSILPEFIDVPNDAGFIVIQAQRPEKPEYEPFTPTSYFYLADFDKEIQTDGTYYFTIYESTGEGRLGIAIGYKEEFTLVEWLRIPLDVIEIHQWEGQSFIFIITPMLVTLIIGFIVIAWKCRLVRGARSLLGILAGLLYLGSGVMVLVQMIVALNGAEYNLLVTLTFIFVLIPILLGVVIIRKIGLNAKTASLRDRILLLILAASGLFSWSGLIIGPVLVVVASILS
jgi:hypothetical protein